MFLPCAHIQYLYFLYGAQSWKQSLPFLRRNLKLPQPDPKGPLGYCANLKQCLAALLFFDLFWLLVSAFQWPFSNPRFFALLISPIGYRHILYPKEKISPIEP